MNNSEKDLCGMREITEAEAKACFGAKSVRYTENGRLNVRRCGINRGKRVNPNIVFQFRDELVPLDRDKNVPIDVTGGYEMPHVAQLFYDELFSGTRILFGCEFVRNCPKHSEATFTICQWEEAKYALIRKEDYAADLAARKKTNGYRYFTDHCEYVCEGHPGDHPTYNSVTSFYVVKTERVMPILKNQIIAKQATESEIKQELAIYLSERFRLNKDESVKMELPEELPTFRFYHYTDGFSAEGAWVIDPRGRLLAPSKISDDEVSNFIGATVARWEIWTNVTKDDLVLYWKKPGIITEHVFEVRQEPTSLTFAQYERTLSLERAIEEAWVDHKSPIGLEGSPKVGSGWNLKAPKLSKA